MPRNTPDQPFFEYLAFTVAAFSAAAPPEDIARYRDRYLEGWDAVRQERWQRMRKMGIVNCDLSAAGAECRAALRFPGRRRRSSGPAKSIAPFPGTR